MSSVGDPYDPSEVESRRKSVYISKKELIGVSIGIALALAVGAYFYNNLKRQAERAVCFRNIRGIGQALELYLQANNDRYPPAFALDEGGDPMVDYKGAMVTWATVIREEMGERVSFQCSTAVDAELVKTSGRSFEPKAKGDKSKDAGYFQSSYGFYLPRSLAERNRIVDENTAVIVAETSNRGSTGTFDPKPLLDRSGKPVPYDGFIVGWDDGNDAATLKSSLVSRLAFPGTSNGTFDSKGKSRHDNGIHVLFVSGGAGTIKPPGARVFRNGPEIFGYWAER